MSKEVKDLAKIIRSDDIYFKIIKSGLDHQTILVKFQAEVKRRFIDLVHKFQSEYPITSELSKERALEKAESFFRNQKAEKKYAKLFVMNREKDKDFDHLFDSFSEISKPETLFDFFDGKKQRLIKKYVDYYPVVAGFYGWHDYIKKHPQLLIKSADKSSNVFRDVNSILAEELEKFKSPIKFYFGDQEYGYENTFNEIVSCKRINDNPALHGVIRGYLNKEEDFLSLEFITHALVISILKSYCEDKFNYLIMIMLENEEKPAIIASIGIIHSIIAMDIEKPITKRLIHKVAVLSRGNSIYNRAFQTVFIKTVLNWNQVKETLIENNDIQEKSYINYPDLRFKGTHIPFEKEYQRFIPFDSKHPEVKKSLKDPYKNLGDIINNLEKDIYLSNEKKLLTFKVYNSIEERSDLEVFDTYFNGKIEEVERVNTYEPYYYNSIILMSCFRELLEFDKYQTQESVSLIFERNHQRLVQERALFYVKRLAIIELGVCFFAKHFDYKELIFYANILLYRGRPDSDWALSFKVLLDKNLRGDALQIAYKGHETNPESPYMWHNFAYCQLMNEMYEEAEEQYLSILEKYDFMWRSAHDLGYLYYKTGESLKSIEYYTIAFQKFPYNKHTWDGLFDGYKKQKDYISTLHLCNEILFYNGETPEVFEEICKLYPKLKKQGGFEVLDINSFTPELVKYIFLFFLHKKRDIQNAIKYGEHANDKFQNKDITILTDLAFTYCIEFEKAKKPNNNTLEIALDYIDQALALDTTSLRANGLKGMILNKLKSFGKALDYLRKGLNGSEEDQKVWICIIDCLEELDQKELIKEFKEEMKQSKYSELKERFESISF